MPATGNALTLPGPAADPARQHDDAARLHRRKGLPIGAAPVGT